MDNKKLKRIMTDLAAGHITKKQADILLKPKKIAESGPKQGKSTIKTNTQETKCHKEKK